MASSRHRLHVAVAIVALGAALVACEGVMGLSNYSIVNDEGEGGEYEYDAPGYDAPPYIDSGMDSTTLDGGDGFDTASADLSNNVKDILLNIEKVI